MLKKLLVETTGDFQLVDYSRQVHNLIPAHRPAVVDATVFVQNNVANGRLKVLGEVAEKATDADFEDTLKNSKNVNMAVDAFKSEFDTKPAPREREPREGRGK